MIISGQTLDLAFKGFKTVFTDAYLETPAHADKIAMTVSSESGDETYGWLGQFPSMREWVGPNLIRTGSHQEPCRQWLHHQEPQV